MSVRCQASEVIECLVHGGDEEEGDAFLAVALCSPVTIWGESDWGCLHWSVSKEIEEDEPKATDTTNKDIFFHIFLSHGAGLTCVSAVCGRHGHQPSISQILLPPDLLC